MIKLEKYEVTGWDHAIRGMRNPMNSWEKSDSEQNRTEIRSGRYPWGSDKDPYQYETEIRSWRYPWGSDKDPYPTNSWEKSDSVYGTYWGDIDGHKCFDSEGFSIGKNDHELMMKLRDAGTDHRKFMRMITVYVDITAPLYWWKEFDTYKVGTVANSCSTMHKIHEKEFTLEDFSHEHLTEFIPGQELKGWTLEENDLIALPNDPDYGYSSIGILRYIIIKALNFNRIKYLETKDKKYWWQMIQLLPSSYNQKRTVMLNYEVLTNIYKSRKNHKLDEWHDFCSFIEGLPYSEIITEEKTND